MKLAGTCTLCKKCCEFLELEVNPGYLTSPDVYRWVRLHGVELVNREGRVFARIPTPCHMLAEDGRCGIYEDRPQVCRVWPMGPEDLEDPRIKGSCTLYFEKDESDLLPMIERRTG